jgi:hypothetical protein
MCPAALSFFRTIEQCTVATLSIEEKGSGRKLTDWNLEMKAVKSSEASSKGERYKAALEDL